MTFTKPARGRGKGQRRTGGYLVRGLNAVRRRWLLVLCVTLACAALAAAFVVLTGGSRYTAESVVLVRDLGETGAGGASGERLAQIRAEVGPEEVSRSAMQEIGWKGSVGEFNRSLEVEAGSGGELGVAFSAPNPEEAARGANAYAAAFVDRMQRLDADRLAGGSLNARGEVVREARPPQPLGLRLPAAVFAALLVGFGAGCGLALALGGGDRRWRDARDTELTLGAPVLGVIPQRRGLPRRHDQRDQRDQRDPRPGDPDSEEGGVVREP